LTGCFNNNQPTLSGREIYRRSVLSVYLRF
jgi:hypothetical protein